jgi:hypothetical protein
MPRVGLEPTISVLEGAKTVHALDSAATVTGVSTILLSSNEDKARKVVGVTSNLDYSTIHLEAHYVSVYRTQR